MTTTVTTTTITTVSLLDLTAIVSLVLVLLLIGTLIAKEIMSSVSDRRAGAVARVLDVAAVPLVLVFGIIIITKLLPSFS